MSADYPFTEVDGEQYLDRVLAMHALNARAFGSNLYPPVQHDILSLSLAMTQWKNDCYPSGTARLSATAREFPIIRWWFVPIAPRTRDVMPSTVLCRKVGRFKPRIELSASQAIDEICSESRGTVGIALHRIREATAWVQSLHRTGKYYATAMMLRAR